jgi:hypothetical protein
MRQKSAHCERQSPLGMRMRLSISESLHAVLRVMVSGQEAKLRTAK